MPDDDGRLRHLQPNRDVFYVDDLHFPLETKHQKVSSEQGVSVAFLSDIHVGSKTFLEAQWHKMVRWFHNDPLAKTIKYLILSGDCVDGVGIYPGQDKELAIPDLFAQYSEFARLLELLPEWVECLMLPGNHDAVRPAEPQPTFEKDIQQDYNTTTFVGNPCDFSLHGVRLLSYHGKSIDDFVAGLRTVTYADPVEAMREMLRRRHLAPQWGGKTPLSPEPEDGLVIREVPDIFVTGHVRPRVPRLQGDRLFVQAHGRTKHPTNASGFPAQTFMLTIINLKSHKSISIPSSLSLVTSKGLPRRFVTSYPDEGKQHQNQATKARTCGAVTCQRQMISSTSRCPISWSGSSVCVPRSTVNSRLLALVFPCQNRPPPTHRCRLRARRW